MSSHPASGGARVGQDEEARDEARIPAESLLGDSGRQARFRVMAPERLLDGGELRLHLDDKEDPRPGMPRQDVDGAALAEDRIGHLGLDDPAGSLEHADRRPHERRVPLVREPVELPASPAQGDHDLGAERLGHRPKAAQRDTFEPACFEARDLRLAQARSQGHVGLPSRLVLAQEPEQSPDPNVVHPDIVGWTA